VPFVAPTVIMIARAAGWDSARCPTSKLPLTFHSLPLSAIAIDKERWFLLFLIANKVHHIRLILAPWPHLDHKAQWTMDNRKQTCSCRPHQTWGEPISSSH
jgi:hypothetical protein